MIDALRQFGDEYQGDAIEQDRTAGTQLACTLAQAVAKSGAFDGIHLIPGVRYRETAALLEGRTPGL